MISELDADGVVGHFRGKSILITGSTGFLGKVLVEKILRVQPDVKKLFLLVRAVDAESAKDRVQTEVIGKEIFHVMKEKHGNRFEEFIKEKIFPLEGDIMYENLGLSDAKVMELSKEIDIIVNGAATTNFFERYDVAVNVNVLGAKHICEFAKRCTNLKMLLHVSTAYVAGKQEGTLLEKPLMMVDTLREGMDLDIKYEINLIKETRRELEANCCLERDEKRTMKELGFKRARTFGWPNTYVFTKAMGEMLLGHLRCDLPVVIVRPSVITSVLNEPLPGWIESVRTIDLFIMGYAKQTLTFFPLDVNSLVDVQKNSATQVLSMFQQIPGDMVVNAMMVAMAAHSEEQTQNIYHFTSSVRNPMSLGTLVESWHRYFFDNPPHTGKNGEPVRLSRMRIFSSLLMFHTYMAISYKLPLEILRLVNIAFCGAFSWHYEELRRNYSYIMLLVKIYAPYSFYKGRFDDTNTERLRVTLRNKEQDKSKGYDFGFDPKVIDWDDYFYRIHIPGLVKYQWN